MTPTPEERALRARVAAYEKWAHTTDPAAETASARAAFLDRFEREVDPDGELDEADRARRAEAARKAHFSRMALKSAQVRRKKGRKKSTQDAPVTASEGDAT